MMTRIGSLIGSGLGVRCEGNALVADATAATAAADVGGGQILQVVAALIFARPLMGQFASDGG